ncbi:CAF17-like 4Fe-4S cluster assembly/insertion protein YgfZ [Gordonia crocea]|uniref:Glycine cleavage system protein T n=1 Tax=Gordonia crocea TaxID=589162 RepID=A0A7I9UUM4_9ACTN|nr:folate-binding protein YgfZ [Gordonia crocea]GED96854.1 glycine cleavage system protein T [Gordonia crocea]
MNQSVILSSLLDAQTASAVAEPDGAYGHGPQSRRVAWHYGDPLGEQRAATTGVILVDRSDRAVLEISGDERLSWLHTISSQFVADLADRHSAENLSLDLNGRIVEHFVLTDIDGVTWIDTPGPRGPELVDFLTKMVFWAKAVPAARPDMCVLTLVGDLTPALAETLEIPTHAQVYDAGDLPELHHDDEPLGFWRIMPPIGEGRRLPVVDLVVPESEAPQRWRALTEAGARPAGSWAYHAHRIAARRPLVHVDTDERAIPHEVHWIGTPAEQGAVHLDKGCYRGQETVARVHNLGRSPRRLVLLHLDGSTDARPETGDPVTAGGRAVGRIGSVVDHFEFGPIALALVKRSVDATAELVVTTGDQSVAARIDPDSIVADEHRQAGREAVDRLRNR